MPSLPCILYILGKILASVLALFLDVFNGSVGFAKPNAMTVLGMVAMYAEDQIDSVMHSPAFVCNVVLCVTLLQFGRHAENCVLSWFGHFLCLCNIALITMHVMQRRLPLAGEWGRALNAATPVLLLVTSAGVCVATSAAQQIAQGIACLVLVMLVGFERGAEASHPVRVTAFTFLCPPWYACAVVLIVLAVAAMDRVPLQRVEVVDDLEEKLRAMEEEYAPARRARARGVFAGL